MSNDDLISSSYKIGKNTAYAMLFNKLLEYRGQYSDETEMYIYFLVGSASLISFFYTQAQHGISRDTIRTGLLHTLKGGINGVAKVSLTSIATVMYSFSSKSDVQLSQAEKICPLEESTCSNVAFTEFNAP